MNYKEDGSQSIYQVYALVLAVPVFILGMLMMQTKGLQRMLEKAMAAEKLVGGMANEFRSLALSEETLNLEKRKFIPILSDKDSAGKGGVGKALGFHTLSDKNEFSLDKSLDPQTKEKAMAHQLSVKVPSDVQVTISRKEDDGKADTQAGKMLKIPSNYYFRNDQTMRWDFSRQTFLPTKKFKGMRYLLRMFGRIQDGLALPGGMPQVQMDRAGRVTFQSIKPQVVDITIMVNRQGDVLDAKIMNSPLQKSVGQAFLKAIIGNHFGEVPPEIEDDPWMIGVSFLIPDLTRIF